jgi:hypothetical protein
MAISGLSNELLDEVMGQLASLPFRIAGEEFKALKQARLVCRRWDHAAGSRLFRILHLRHVLLAPEANEPPSYDSEKDQTAVFTKWHETVDLATVRHAARRVIVHTVPENLYNGFPGDVRGRWKSKVGAPFPGFEAALERIAELPYLNAVEVHFYENCIAKPDGSDYYISDFESRSARQNSLKAIFRAIQRRKRSRLQETPVRCLALWNLQNVTDKKFEASSLFRSVMADIS